MSKDRNVLTDIKRPGENLRPVNQDGSVCKEFPKYVSHKEVWALKIKYIDFIDGGEGGAWLVFENEDFQPIKVTAEYVKRHDPTHDGIGWDEGYYVIYKDGYKSWSPTEAFEEGYTLIK